MANSLNATQVAALLTPAFSAGSNITGATAATPIVLTVAAGHALATGDWVLVENVGGQTGANGVRKVSVAANAVTLLGSTTVGAYTTGGTIKKITGGLVCKLKPGDIRDIETMLSRVKVDRGTDNVRTNETTLDAIL